MADTTEQKRSFRVEREFGVLVGGVLVLLCLWWIYRGRFPTFTSIGIPVGAVLVLLGLIIPRALVYPNKAWLAFAAGLSYVMTRIVLAIVFFGVVLPIGYFKRFFGWDPLNRRAELRDSYWNEYSERQKDTRHYEKMY